MKTNIKPLQWDCVYEYGCICRASTPVGTYSIHQDEDSCAGAVFCFLHLTEEGDCTRYAVEVFHGYFDDHEAQEAAGDDYLSRVLSCLEPPV
jgi:hypothetical protein